MFETLEHRRLLSHTLEGGVLTIEGTNLHDRITVGLREGNLVIRFNLLEPETVPAADVNSIVINGNDGNDSINILPAVQQDATLNGGGGNDALNGGAGDDVLNGAAGNDKMNGGLGADVMNGGEGHDGVLYNRKVDVNVTLDDNADDGAAGEGDNAAGDIESVSTGSGNDTIVGNASHNRLNGGPGNDNISGEGGNDLLNGGAGNDVLNGGDGNDVLEGGAGGDEMNGGAGIDLISYAQSPRGVTVTLDGVADDGIPATTEHPAEGDNAGGDVENVNGSKFNDTITGNALNNRLNGGGGNDVLRGGEGNDALNGGPGHDELYGEGGNDLLIGRDGVADLLDGGAGDDRAERDALDTLIDVERTNPVPTA